MFYSRFWKRANKETLKRAKSSSSLHFKKAEFFSKPNLIQSIKFQRIIRYALGIVIRDCVCENEQVRKKAVLLIYMFQKIILHYN